MAKKIAMIGAGSIVFCKTLMSDIMATPTLADSEFALMSLTEPKLRRMESFGRRMLKENNLPGSVWATLDRTEALKDADFVVVMIQVGGLDAFETDYKIPLKYGVDQCVGDTLGPGGVFRGLRTIPVLIDIARDMEKLAK
ncbi:MAG: family 4 glycosyl hydrolase, partial [Planctomycetota bacterium]